LRMNLQHQLPIVYPYIDHEHAEELRKIGLILDRLPLVDDLVYEDLVRDVDDPQNGRPGLSGAQVLRLIVLKQMNGFSYQELAFHLADSRSYRAFCGFGIDEHAPSRATLQANIKKVRAETLETVNRLMVIDAGRAGMENGRKVRMDSTVVPANIHAPSDSSLLWDSVRVLTRLVERGGALTGSVTANHTLRAKRRSLGILNTGSAKQRKALYRDLLKVTAKTVSQAERMVPALLAMGTEDAVKLGFELEHFAALARRVIDQTERRVLAGEKVPASEKVVSIFEEHADVIVKDRRETYYGHKIFLTTGQSGLFLDCAITDGNPADSSLAVPMIERLETKYERVPRQAAFDGGFASKDNLRGIKQLGVSDVAFSKKRGLDVAEMVKNSWVYKRLRNFRAGVEGMISFLKRCFGLDRCTWRSLRSFHSYVWGSVVSANLLLMARHAME
jgi:transposase, IS5 family